MESQKEAIGEVGLHFESKPNINENPSSFESLSIDLKGRKSLERALRYAKMNELQVDQHKVKVLLAELNGTVLASKAAAFENKLVLTYQEADLELFNEITKYRKLNPLSSQATCLENFVHRKNSDALVKIAYGAKLDSVIKYSIVEPLPTPKNKRYLKDTTFAALRARFLVQLLRKDLFLVLEISVFDVNERFLQIVGGFEALTEQAEEIGLMFQLSNSGLKTLIPAFADTVETSSLRNSVKFMSRWNSTDFIEPLSHPRAEISVHKRSAVFKCNDISLFKGGDASILGLTSVKESFLFPRTRNLLVCSIVNRCSIKLEYHNQRASGISQLLAIGVFESYFAMHDNSLLEFDIKEDSNIPPGTRAALRQWTDKLFWLSNGKDRLLNTPLNDIRDYFGESIAFYFAWLDYYTKWFKYLAAIGVIVFAYGVIAMLKYEKKLIYIFDNPITPIFAFVINVWSLLFLKFWKRKTNYLSFVWDMDNIDEIEQQRVEWEPTHRRRSPVTGKEVEYVPTGIIRYKRALAITAVLLGFLFLSGFVVVGVLLIGFFREKLGWGRNSSLVVTSFFTLLQIVVIVPIFKRFSMALTVFENFKMPSKFMSNLIAKEFLMSFVNSYGLLFFSAVIRPVIYQMTTNFEYFGFFTEICIVEGGFNSCFKDLVISIVIIFAGTQYLFQIFQIVYPYVVKLWTKKSNRECLDDENIFIPVPMKESELVPITISSLSMEYSNKIVQLGYVLLFSAPFPLAPLLGWISNLFEIRLDLFKFLTLLQRPFSSGAKSIGQWENIMTVLVYLGGLVNAIVIAFLSSIFEEQGIINSLETNQISLLTLRFAFIVVFEHILILIAVLIDWTISDIPTKVKIGREAEAYIANVRDEVDSSDEDDINLP